MNGASLLVHTVLQTDGVRNGMQCRRIHDSGGQSLSCNGFHQPAEYAPLPTSGGHNARRGFCH